jgi:putative SOS response-associated peptidase YedK
MCARYTLTKRQEALLQAYNVKFPDFEPNYNLAPTQQGLVITSDEPDIAQTMHFGLVPHWSAEPKVSFATWNAASEDVMDKKSYQPLITHHKTCLVLAHGFYEWDKKSGKSLPYRFTLKDRELFAFAGLWSQWKSKDGTQVYRSFTIMTTVANATVSKIHDPKNRMPVILDRYSEPFWLSKNTCPKDLLSLCRPYADDQMEAYRVSTAVNAAIIKNVVNNKPELMMPMNSQ